MHVDVHDLFRLLIIASAAELDGKVRLVTTGATSCCWVDVCPDVRQIGTCEGGMRLRDSNKVEACRSSSRFGKAYFAVFKARSRDRSAPEKPHIACLQFENILSRYDRVRTSLRHFDLILLHSLEQSSSNTCNEVSLTYYSGGGEYSSQRGWLEQQ